MISRYPDLAKRQTKSNRRNHLNGIGVNERTNRRTDIQAISRLTDRQNGLYSNCVDTANIKDAIMHTWYPLKRDIL